MNKLFIPGNKYNWKSQRERLVYLGKKGAWYQFALVEKPEEVWCEILPESFDSIEETTELT